MATTRERREEYSSNVVRTLHPSRPLSPANNSANYPVNDGLDDLLDDLQTTVTRTADHLNKSRSRDVQYLSPSNTTTVVHERSVSPGGQDGSKIYKSSSYEYSSSARTGGSGTLDSRNLNTTNVSQLDNLLEDLKHERHDHVSTLDRDVHLSNVGIDDGLLEPNARIVKTTRTVTNSSGGSKGVNRELKFDSPSLVQQTLNTHDSRSRQRSRSPNYQSHVESHITRDNTYDTEPVRDQISSASKRYNYSKTTERTGTLPYNTDIVEVETTDLPRELKEIPLSSDILPGPGTKVTTTIKTFTYEIPGDTNVPTNKNFTYKNEFYNSANTSTTNQVYPERDIPPPGGNQTLIYKNESHNTVNRNETYPGYTNGIPPVHPDPGVNQTYIYKKESSETTNNVYGQPHRPVSPLPPTNSTLIYQQDTSNTTRNVHHPPAGGVQVFPYEPSNAHLPPPGGKQTYLYKKETSNTTNTVYGPPGENSPDYNGPPYVQPVEPTTTMYKYTSNSSHTTNVHGQPREVITPFPTDGYPTQVDGNSPKHLNELLDTLGDRNDIDGEPYTPRKEVNTALATNKPVAIVDPKPPTKNIAGPPVYYPPGQELFAKSEQKAAWRAGGGYAKASGKYEYEAESKSKSSSKSGAAVVPVCLPLCCAMPCSIM